MEQPRDGRNEDERRRRRRQRAEVRLKPKMKIRGEWMAGREPSTSRKGTYLNRMRRPIIRRDRDGHVGERSGLLDEIRRLVRRYRPTHIRTRMECKPCQFTKYERGADSETKTRQKQKCEEISSTSSESKRSIPPSLSTPPPAPPKNQKTHLNRTQKRHIHIHAPRRHLKNAHRRRKPRRVLCRFL